MVKLELCDGDKVIFSVGFTNRAVFYVTICYNIVVKPVVFLPTTVCRALMTDTCDTSHGTDTAAVE